MNDHNKIILTSTLSIALLLSACQEKPSQKVEQKPEPQPSSEVKTLEVVEIPTTVQSTILVNNPTPLPQGYEVDTTHLKKPKLIDFNGDGKLDAFQVLKNPNKKGMKYLFEFRIADSDKVYWYESEDKEYDLDGFEVFEKAGKGEKFVNIRKLDEAELVSYEDAPSKARFILQNNGITVGYPESCGTSLFYIDKDKVQRIHLD
ncbi:hypothetical protein [Acinetobacter shaoyimingii]|uniref:hypothetical protein n=1 Tax=Acinetobacter shaoyimingii TaxID=2715164 RepID=UPI001D0DD150|nr:hypothetical protein [Acinetobacter shaoyimingii]